MAEGRWEAYCQHLQKYLDSRDEEGLKAAFALVDLDGDGEVSKEELASMLAAGPRAAEAQELTERMFAVGDADGSGKLDDEEFAAMVLQISGI
jgi:Ca2+-binding EF-hand superfamily protein